jgi:hypothetical protein
MVQGSLESLVSEHLMRIKKFPHEHLMRIEILIFLL